MEWCIGEVWDIENAGTAEATVRMIYIKDAYSETIPLAGKDAPAFVRLREGNAEPSVLREATSHQTFLMGLFARSSEIKPAPWLAPGVPFDPRCAGFPLRLIPDTQLVFYAQQDQGLGGLSSVVCPLWGGGERPGDLIIQVSEDDHSKD